MGQSNSVQSLIDALEHESGLVQQYAVKTLGQIGDSQAVDPLIRALKSENKTLRIHIVKALMKIGRPAVISLIVALRDENPDVWRLCAAALVKIGDDAVPSLINAFADESAPIRLLIIEILGQIGDVRASNILVGALRSENPDLQAAASIALIRIGPGVITPLLDLLIDFQDAALRRTAIDIVIQMGERAVDSLKTSMVEGTELERNQAGWLLSEMGDEGINALLSVLNHPSDFVRCTATWSLGNTRSPRVVPELVVRLSDNGKSMFSGLRVSDAAVKSLERIGTPEALASLERWRRTQAKQI